jgi:hypothetical protein
METIKTGKYGVKLHFDTTKTPVESVIPRLTQVGTLVDITISDPELEEVIATIYAEADSSIKPESQE